MTTLATYGFGKNLDIILKEFLDITFKKENKHHN